jgi:hypothetical protein
LLRIHLRQALEQRQISRRSENRMTGRKATRPGLPGRV